ncbi:hypothetical protein F4780DRAFT_766845 [Xylariomycetidae sp. FL0641]|nr:hypothetical protein F4780DRAFT_766845 [Xylariomycetidae sp. FL0641]
MVHHERVNQNEEAEPLWPSPEEKGRPEDWTSARGHEGKRYHGRCIAILIGLYAILLALYVVLLIGVVKGERPALPDESILFPSLEQSSAFRRSDRVFPLTVAGTPFAGDPSPELDQAWHELLKDTTIRVSEQDLEFYNVTSLPLADGSGYASELFLTHELHCLKKIRQYIYKDVYFDDVRGFARNELKRHIDHCIETLRQGILCRGDVSLGTYTYLRGSSDVTARSWGPHQCVDAEALLTWSRGRAVDIFQPGVLEAPENVGEEHFTERKQPHLATGR